MSCKNIACVVALLAVAASPASADPSLRWKPNEFFPYGGTSTLQIIPDGTGSIEAEILITTQFDLVGANLVDPATFDTPNPGNNPITGTVTNGLFLDPANNQLFASFGTQILNSTEPIDFIHVNVQFGRLYASGLIAEGGVNFTDLTADVLIPQYPDGGDDGDIDGDDFGVFVGQFGNTNGLSPPDTQDFDLDGDVDGDDFGFFIGLFNNENATTIPEPTAALLLLVGVTVVTCTSHRK